MPRKFCKQKYERRQEIYCLFNHELKLFVFRIDSSLSMPSVVTKLPLPNIIVEETPIYIETSNALSLNICGSFFFDIYITRYNRSIVYQYILHEPKAYGDSLLITHGPS